MRRRVPDVHTEYAGAFTRNSNTYRDTGDVLRP
jgi:hypothetical protein